MLGGGALGGGALGGGVPPPIVPPPVSPIWKPPLDCTFCQAPQPIATRSTRPTNAAHPGDSVRAKMNFRSPKPATPSPRNPVSLSADMEPMFMFAMLPVIDMTPTTMSAIASSPATRPKKLPLPLHIAEVGAGVDSDEVVQVAEDV